MTTTKNIYALLGISGAFLLGLMMISWAVLFDVPDFSQYKAGDERKQVFFDYFLPLIKKRNAEILETREKVSAWSGDRENIGWWSRFQINNIAETYRLDDFDIDSDEDWDTLLSRVDVIPASLAVAQAAKESGWGTSRFGREGHNYYGQWCDTPGCGLVPGKRNKDVAHEVAVFDSPEDSVDSYLRNINSHKAYRKLRVTRASLRAADKPITGIELAGGLGSYSQRGDDYIDEVRSIIRRNDLLQHDID